MTLRASLDLKKRLHPCRVHAPLKSDSRVSLLWGSTRASLHAHVNALSSSLP